LAKWWIPPKRERDIVESEGFSSVVRGLKKLEKKLNFATVI